MQARALAATALAESLTRRQRLDTVLPDRLENLTNTRDRAFAQELCYGVMRWYFRLVALLAELLAKKLHPRDTDIKMLLLIGMYQFDFLATPEHAIVAATVDACEELDKAWAKKLVNAILRRYQRERLVLLEKFRQDSAIHYAHPGWLLRILQQDYPHQWQAIVTANNQRPPLYLRVNLRQITRADYLTMLRHEDIEAVSCSNTTGIKLTRPVPVADLPGFEDGLVSVQDLAAQLAAPLLDARAGQRVLDAAAAPGGKLAHLLEAEPGLDETVAVELAPERVRKLHQTLNRLRLQARIIEADARQPAGWWDGVPFDRILLDAPCTACGVIRRHPDIKVLRRARDLDALTTTQTTLLNALWPLLKPGGKLLYSTCSILKQENDYRIREFIASHEDARTDTIGDSWGLATNFGRQNVPGQDDMDGFYYARLQKI